jgi:hypothetical protein
MNRCNLIPQMFFARKSFIDSFLRDEVTPHLELIMGLKMS